VIESMDKVTGTSIVAWKLDIALGGIINGSGKL